MRFILIRVLDNHETPRAPFLLFGGVSWSNQVKECRTDAIKSFAEFWEKPARLAMRRRAHNIPESYSLKDLGLIDEATDKKHDLGLYKWAFYFGES